MSRLGAIALLACLAGPVGAQDLGRDPAVRTGVLSNGLTYYVRANQRPENRAELRLVVDVGSVVEDPDQLGLAHFAEHMAFNGTARFPKLEIVDYMERIGMRFGADVNASTHFDQTIYELTVPTDSSTFMETALEILVDWASAVSFDPAEIERERGVVLEEWRLGRGAWARITDQHFPVLFAESRYAERLPIGTPENLRTFAHGVLTRFYDDWYRPDLMAIIAVGDFDPAVMEQQIRSHFGPLARRDDPRPRPSFDVPGHAQPLYAIATDPEETNTIVTVYFKHQAAAEETVSDYRESIVERLFTSMLNDRLFEIQFQPDAPFLFAGIGQGRFVRPLEVWGMNAGVRDGEVLIGLEALLTEAARVAQHGFTQTELDRHRTDLLRGMERTFAERDKIDSRRFAGEYVRHFIENEPFPGIAAEFELYQQLLPTVMLEEVNALAADLLGDRDRVVLVGGPATAPMPDTLELRDTFGRVAAAEVAAYVDETVDGTLMEDLPEPGAVVSRTEHAELGVTDWTLSNGARVILKPTDFQDDEILFRAMSPGGTSLAADSNYVAAMMAASIVGASGVGELDIFELQKALSGKVAYVYPEIYGIAEGLSGRASPQDLETMLRLAYLYVTAPRRDSSAFVAIRQQNQEMVRNRGASPEVAFSDTVQAILSQNHHRTRPFTAELLDEMDLDFSMRFYRDRFADVSDFTFVFVGNFSVDSIEPLVTRYIASLPSTGREETWIDREILPPTGVIQRELYRGIEPKSTTQIVFTGELDWTPEDAHVLGSMASVLDIWLRESLREALGGTYGAGVGGSAQRVPRESYSVGINFGSAPDRVGEMLETVWEEIERLKTEGPSVEDVAKVQEGQRRQRETALRRNSYWLNQLMSVARYGGEFGQILDVEQRIEALTPDAIREAARRFLRNDNYILVTMYPEAVN